MYISQSIGSEYRSQPMTNEIAIASEGARGLEVTVCKERFSTQNLRIY